MVFSVAIVGCTEKVSFSRDVMPILAESCLSCHQQGAEGYVASGFSVESYADIMQGTNAGPVIDPGVSYASTLQVLVEHKADPSIAMPLKMKKLSAAKTRVIGEWIDQGALNN